jgi:flagellar hook-basal body complex protein FliE
MSIEAISAAGSFVSGLAEARPAQPTSQVDFTRWMTEQLGEVNQQIQGAEQSLVQLAAGDANLHQVMLDLEKARTAFQLTLQVRNKLLEGYQELLRMQV